MQASLTHLIILFVVLVVASASYYDDLSSSSNLYPTYLSGYKDDYDYVNVK